MKKNNVLFLISLLGLISFNGCSQKQDSIKISEEREDKDLNIVLSEKAINKIGNSLQSTASKVQIYWFDLNELEKKRKGYEREIPEYSVPDGMGRIVSFQFNGRSLTLLKQLAQMSGYKVDTKIDDTTTKIISKDFRDRKIYDIFEEIIPTSDIKMLISTEKRIITLIPED